MATKNVVYGPIGRICPLSEPKILSIIKQAANKADYYGYHRKDKKMGIFQPTPGRS